jgi:hypothetical protein
LKNPDWRRWRHAAGVIGLVADDVPEFLETFAPLVEKQVGILSVPE